MLFKAEELERIARGEITVALRRWRRPTVRAGGRLTTSVGVLAIDRVDRVDIGELVDEDARAAGFDSVRAARAALDRRREGTVYRIALRVEGPDPRLALRDEIPDDRALAETIESLRRMDNASRRGPWTRATLKLVADRPGVRAADLAADLGRADTAAFKVDVRKLKARGLTESLETGYRLSPRGVTVLDALALDLKHT